MDADANYVVEVLNSQPLLEVNVGERHTPFENNDTLRVISPRTGSSGRPASNLIRAPHAEFERLPQ